MGLYPAPPENAILLSVDEKSQIQALDRTAPVLPMQPHLIERRSHDDVRHGTTTLFAALEVATGKVTAALKPRHRHSEFLAFLKQIDRAYPADADNPHVGQLHLVMDNYAAHKQPKVKAWPAEHPRIHVHISATHGLARPSDRDSRSALTTPVAGARQESRPPRRHGPARPARP